MATIRGPAISTPCSWVVAVLAALLAFAAVAAAFVFLPRISPWLDRRLQVSAALRWAMLAMPLLVTAGVVGA